MTKRNLKEAASTIEVGISKCLSGNSLSPIELDEMRHITYADLMTDHGLDSLMAERVKVHVQNEIQRERAQSLQTWKPESREAPEDYPFQASHTNPLRESISTISEMSHVDLEDIMDMDVDKDHHDAGRMLDYGHTKSDSHEGRMMRQALDEMAEYSRELHDLLNDDDDLPQWCHYKVAVGAFRGT